MKQRMKKRLKIFDEWFLPKYSWKRTCIFELTKSSSTVLLSLSCSPAWCRPIPNASVSFKLASLIPEITLSFWKESTDLMSFSVACQISWSAFNGGVHPIERGDWPERTLTTGELISLEATRPEKGLEFYEVFLGRRGVTMTNEGSASQTCRSALLCSALQNRVSKMPCEDPTISLAVVTAPANLGKVQFLVTLLATWTSKKAIWKTSKTDVKW